MVSAFDLFYLDISEMFCDTDKYSCFIISCRLWKELSYNDQEYYRDMVDEINKQF